MRLGDTNIEASMLYQQDLDLVIALGRGPQEKDN